jgi:hypothetical protein
MAINIPTSLMSIDYVSPDDANVRSRVGIVGARSNHSTLAKKHCIIKAVALQPSGMIHCRSVGTEVTWIYKSPRLRWVDLPSVSRSTEAKQQTPFQIFTTKK